MLASSSPQRRAILEQLGVPFRVVEPRYDERDDAGASPAELVRAHALGKARSVAAEAGDRPVLGVDTAVVVDGRILGKPADEEEAAAMLALLAGRAHAVVSGLCLLGPEWEEVGHEETRVDFRPLSRRTSPPTSAPASGAAAPAAMRSRDAGPPSWSASRATT